MKKLGNFAKKISKLIRGHQFILYLAMFCLIYALCLWIQLTPTFLDPDSFYHLKMTKLIAERGIVMDFPWMQFTVLKDYYIDHHLLYHIAGIPFVKLFGDFNGYKLYTVFLATGFLLFLYFFFRRFQVKYAEIFIFLLLSSSSFMFRLNLAKASAFSLLILFLGIYCLFKRQNWLLFLLSFLYVWSYGGFLLILLVTAVYILADSLYSAFISKSWLEVFKIKLRIYKLKDHWRKFFKNLFSLANIKLGFASLSGIILGVVISPYFPRNLKFYWQQVVEIGLINYRDQVNVGGEWYPMSWADLLVKIGVLSVFVLIALLLFFVFIKKQNSYSIFFFFLSVLFIGLTLKSQRYIEYSTPFVACFAAFTFSNFLQEIDWRHWWRELGKDFLVLRYFICVLALLVAICFPFFMIKSLEETKKSYQSGFSFNVFAGVSEYLRENSQNGDIVMHTDWSDWPMLFYQNHQNYYIVGLDPTFMYKYNPALYRLFEDITMSRKASRLYLDIKEVFRAKYFIVNEGRDQLSRDLEKSGHFIKVYQDQDAAVYKVYP